MHRLIAAKTGWGKSWYGQAIMEANLREYPTAVVADYKDEYRGLVEAGLAKHLILGPTEAEWSVKQWREVLKRNPRLVLARYRLDADEWAEAIATVIEAVRVVGQQAGGSFTALDEAHFLAPQRGKIPKPTKGLATTGRGEQASSLWLTQRLSELEETIIAQADQRLFGGFISDADLDKLERVVEYPRDVHNPTLSKVGILPEELKVNGAHKPLRKFTDSNGSTIGSEWIFSDGEGALERRDTRTVSMEATHYGPEGRDIHDP